MSTCDMSYFNLTYASTSLVIIGANASFPEVVTVQNSAHDVYTLIASMTNFTVDENIWLYYSENVSALHDGNLWVNLSVPTRYMVSATDIVNATGSFVDSLSTGGRGTGITFTQALNTSTPGDVVVLAAFDNRTYASTVCNFNGTLVANGSDEEGWEAGTYRNLDVGYIVDHSTGPVSLSFRFANRTSSPCAGSTTPYVGYMVAFKAGPPPTILPLGASFTFSPERPLVGASVQFTSNITGAVPPYSYSWSFGDKTVARTADPSHVYSLARSFTVYLNVTDSNYPKATISVTETVTTHVVRPIPPPPPAKAPRDGSTG